MHVAFDILFFFSFAGDFVRLDGVHLWDNVRVDDGCNVSKSILCKNVHIKRYILNAFVLSKCTEVITVKHGTSVKVIKSRHKPVKSQITAYGNSPLSQPCIYLIKNKQTKNKTVFLQ